MLMQFDLVYLNILENLEKLDKQSFPIENELSKQKYENLDGSLMVILTWRRIIII